MNDLTDLILWMDTTCPAAFPRRRERWNTVAPELVTAPRPSWRDNQQARIRMALRAMPPDSRCVIEGVGVRYMSANMGQVLFYAIDRDISADHKPYRYDFAAACERIAEIARAKAEVGKP